MNTLFRRVLFAAYLFVVTIIVLELSVRLWGYSEQYIFDPIYAPFEQTKAIPYIYKPSLANARALGLVILNTDSLGLRAKVSGAHYGPKLPHEYRIAIAGDSVTFGTGVQRTEDTFSQVLEDTLNRKQAAVKAQIFNYGVGGYSVKEIAATLQYRMLDIDPDLVFMAIIADDFNLARTPTINSAGYLVDKRRARVMPPDSAIRRVLRNVHLTYLLRDIAYSWFHASRIDSPANGELPESFKYVHQFVETAEQHHVPYLIVLLPSSERTDLFDHVSKKLRRDHITFVDLSRLRDEFTQQAFKASQFDGHPSAGVHHRIGESLADYVLNVQWQTGREVFSR